MIGTWLNAAGIIIGGALGLRSKPLMHPSNEAAFKVLIGAFTVYYGLRLTWLSINGSLPQVLKQFAIAVVAMMLGNLTGTLLKLQRLSNSVGSGARETIEASSAGSAALPSRGNDGFKVCSSLYCAAPLGWLGALQDGLTGYFFPLAVKGVIEGLSTSGFVKLFGWKAILSFIPVVALQGTITLCTFVYLRPFLEQRELLSSVNAVGGMLVFSTALVILNIKRVQLANYMPSILFAPLLTWIFK